MTGHLFKRRYAAIMLLLSGFTFAAVALAQVQINTNIPFVSEASNPCSAIFSFYKFALMFSGVLAFGAIVYGGIKYTLAVGNPSGQSEGKEWVKGALLGLLLLVSAYLILNVINPNLTKCTLPELAGVTITAPPTLPIVDSGTCGNLVITPCPSSDSACLAMEGGATVVWNAPDPSVNQNLVKMYAEFIKLQALVSSHGGSARETSVYRPVSYQTHLYSIYQASQHYDSNQALYNNNPDCGPYVIKLIAEEQHHGICYDGHPCLVASPDGSAPHTRGTGVDIVLSGIAYSDINNLLSNAGINLRWQNASNDIVHFNYTGP